MKLKERQDILLRLKPPSPSYGLIAVVVLTYVLNSLILLFPEVKRNSLLTLECRLDLVTNSFLVTRVLG